jgi:hypothetical protein
MDLGQDICIAIAALTFALLFGFTAWLLKEAFKK